MFDGRPHLLSETDWLYFRLRDQRVSDMPLKDIQKGAVIVVINPSGIATEFWGIIGAVDNPEGSVQILWSDQQAYLVSRFALRDLKTVLYCAH